MINNDFSNSLNRFFNSRANANKNGGAADVYRKLKEKQDAIAGKTAPEAETAGTADAEQNLTAEQKRQKEVQEILDRINAEEASRKRNTSATAAATDTAEDESTTAAATTQKGAAQSLDLDQYGFPEFLNDMPLFDQFKKDLTNAFNNLDGASSGAIRAQFEINYTAVQSIANEAGGFDVTETNFSFKLDMNYVKAASGKSGNASLSDLFGTAKKNPSANDLMQSMQDYFSPEKTAERIVDFSTAFFPNSSMFKAKGDTEEARSEFAEMMRGAVQKGFDQAMGKLGKVPSAVQDGIDKTHELTFKGIDDFVKYGMNRNQESKNDQFYEALQSFAMSMSQSYTQRTYSTTYSPTQSATANPTDAATVIDAQA